MLRRAALAALTVVLLCAASAAPGERLADPAQEARARALFRDVRCLVCQSESIDQSDADLAHDLRQLIRAQISEGRSDAQIRAYLVSRYGQFVLLAPRLDLANAVLWAGPLMVIVVGGVAFLVRRRGAPTEPKPLSAEEETEISEVLRQ